MAGQDVSAPDTLYHLIDDIALDAAEGGAPWVIRDHWYYRGAFLIAGAPRSGRQP